MFLLVSIAADQLAQLVLLGELLAQVAQVRDQGAAALDDGFLGGLLTICLHAQLDLCEEGVRDCVHTG